ncbi:MAG: hypothetical protein IT324_10125, partial [Anaerolineae bacterium]|nr:hypothetical protein [Anaerolineae bacterium]
MGAFVGILVAVWVAVLVGGFGVSVAVRVGLGVRVLVRVGVFVRVGVS